MTFDILLSPVLSPSAYPSIAPLPERRLGLIEVRALAARGYEVFDGEPAVGQLFPAALRELVLCLAVFAYRDHLGPGLWLRLLRLRSGTELRPLFHQPLPLFERITAAVGFLSLITDLVPKLKFQEVTRVVRFIAAPISKGGTKAVWGDSIPMLVAPVAHTFHERQHCPVGKCLPGSGAWEDVVMLGDRFHSHKNRERRVRQRDAQLCLGLCAWDGPNPAIEVNLIPSGTWLAVLLDASDRRLWSRGRFP